MTQRFVELVAEAGLADPGRRGRALMLLLEGALVTLATRAFDDPLPAAREAARALLTDGATSWVPLPLRPWRRRGRPEGCSPPSLWW